MASRHRKLVATTWSEFLEDCTKQFLLWMLPGKRFDIYLQAPIFLGELGVAEDHLFTDPASKRTMLFLFKLLNLEQFEGISFAHWATNDAKFTLTTSREELNAPDQTMMEKINNVEKKQTRVLEDPKKIPVKTRLNIDVCQFFSTQTGGSSTSTGMSCPFSISPLARQTIEDFAGLEAAAADEILVNCVLLTDPTAQHDRFDKGVKMDVTCQTPEAFSTHVPGTKKKFRFFMLPALLMAAGGKPVPEYLIRRERVQSWALVNGRQQVISFSGLHEVERFLKMSLATDEEIAELKAKGKKDCVLNTLS
eukprot:CAMPEP_0172687504 /NCGR_PEP_ID=MMETSP1074-20121228/21730_1 /TAXON_ID=2916 /ORGANISM="Ceratium fusus, Strain PA161109" /LENGTH=306 /DNA_ID=CAMNT_0013506969 /DNA_START=201 /DNA_END=1121 /DNA_ORIENTATION=+